MMFIVCYHDIFIFSCVFFQAEDGIRDLVRSRGLGDVYKRQVFDGLGAVGAIEHLFTGQLHLSPWTILIIMQLSLSLIHI